MCNLFQGKNDFISHLDHEHNVSTRTMQEVIYTFNKSIRINKGSITWPGGERTKITGVKRKEPPAPPNTCTEKKRKVDNDIHNYKQMLEMMHPGESVARTLRRLEGGKTGMSDSQKLKTKKKNVTQESLDPIKINMMQNLVTEIQSININIYEETYQSMQAKIWQLQAVAGDDAVRVEEHQEAEEALRQSEDQDEEDGKTGSRGRRKEVHLAYQNSPEEILSLESSSVCKSQESTDKSTEWTESSRSSTSDWSPPSKHIRDDGENEIRIGSLRQNVNCQLPGGGWIIHRDRGGMLTVPGQDQPTASPDQDPGHSYHQESDHDQDPAHQPKKGPYHL